MNGWMTELLAAIMTPQVISTRTGNKIIAPPGWQNLSGKVPIADPLHIATLTGLRDYLKDNIDEHEKSSLLLHVAGPNSVTLAGTLEDESNHFRRQIFVTVGAKPALFPWGQYMSHENFVIGLMTQFVASPSVLGLQSFVSSIRESGVRDSLDDGLSQEVKTQKGIQVLDRAKVPNPVMLAPWRTFREVGQPESPFILRLRDSGEGKPMIALFECDGGLWEIKAIENVAEWLRREITDVAVIA